MPLIVFIFTLVYAQNAAAYPEFIGYKYSSCLTCHFNGNGNGPLNDYGRALWASEIAGRWLAKGRNEEKLAQSSGFLGKRPLPWWIRPGIKGRQLQMIQNPGGSSSQSRSILMQAEVNAAVFLKKDQSLAIVGSYGYVPVPNRLKGQSSDVKTWISREHYLRWQSSEPLWWYVGMTDKVFGIRIINHTAYSRARTGISMNDQAHGIIAHYIQPKYEISTNLFLGNLYQQAALRQAGVSSMFEYEYKEAARLGASILASSNKYVGNQRLAIHHRQGFGRGTALLFELGLIRDAPKTSNALLGYYVFSEGIQKIKRGYHLFVSGQAYKKEMKATQSDSIKFSGGLLAFPMDRLELRLEFENTRQLKDSPSVGKEEWLAMGQLHVSL